MPPQNESSFQERVRLERERLGLSQTDFGRLGGVSKMAQWQYEHGKHWPTLEYIENLQASGDVDIVYLVTGTRVPADRLDWEILGNALLFVKRSFASRTTRKFTDQQLVGLFRSVVETAMGFTRPDLLDKTDDGAAVAHKEKERVGRG